MNLHKASARTLAAKTENRTAAEPAPRLVDRQEPIDAHEIQKRLWPAFCHWFTENFRGIGTSLERDIGANARDVECLDRPLLRLQAVLLENGVMAIQITLGADGKNRVYDAAGPAWLRLHCNAAGFPKSLEIGCDKSTMRLRFTGQATGKPVFTSNSWGE